MKPKIDPEFQAIMPPLSAEERIGLEASIAREGCRDALLTWDGILVDGHHRLAICERLGKPYRVEEIKLEDRLAVKRWIRGNALARRNLTPDQRRVLLGQEYLDEKKEPHRPEKGAHLAHLTGKTADRIAEREGVDPATVRRAATDVEEIGPKAAADVLAGKTTLKAAKKEAKRRNRNKRLKRREKEAKKIPADAIRLYVGDLLEAGVNVKDGEVHAIITDPPYGREALPLYDRLAELADRVLVPGGVCLVMTGQAHLEDILHRLSSRLSYVWTLAYMTGGASVQVFGRRVKSNWKPVLYYVKGKPEWEHVDDVIKSAASDKRFHEWGQSESGMAAIVERFTVHGQVILDPFCGAGTTGVAAIGLDRRFIGIDTEAKNIKTTKKRLEQ